MIRKYRSKYDIIYNILKNLYNLKNTGERPTRLMEKSNLNPEMLEYYLGILINNNFVVLNNKKYYITEIGIRFLKRINPFIKLINKLEIKDKSK